MDPITSLLADFSFGLAFIAMAFILYRIGTYHARRGSMGLSMRHDDAEAANAARVRVETVQGEVSLSENPECAQSIGATPYHH